MNARASVRAAAAALLLFVALFAISPRQPVVVSTVDALQSQLTDREFWDLITGMSEPGGTFRSDNLISNEETFQHVIPELQRRLAPGAAYLGVGPDQNFTYIVAVEPKIAFVVDIRRDNMLLHLMYKAILEMSPSRAEMLSRLFSRPRPAGLSAESSARDLFDAYAPVQRSRELFDRNLAAITTRLIEGHGFELSQADLSSIEYIYRAFYENGPDLRYSAPRQGFGGGFGGRFFPTYAELMTESDAEGAQHSYFATERHYEVLRDYEQRNLVVPVVGDFGGDKALRAVGRYLKENGATVRLFYTSNVEQYLFQSDSWRKFYRNVGALPIDASSILLRSHFNMFRYPAIPFGSPFTARSGMLYDSIPSLLTAVRDGRIRSYYDVIEHSR